MTVYVVTYEGGGWDRYHTVDAVFSTEELAWKYIDEQNPNTRHNYDIVEFEVDEEVK